MLVVVAMPLLLFVGSNLVMWSGWFRGKIEGQLARHTRLFWTVEEASWSPWGGVRLGRLTAVAAGAEVHTIPPVFEIGELRVQPDWGRLMSGRLRIRELRVTEPRGKFPLELLVQLMKSDGRVDVARLGAATEAAPAPGEGEKDPTPDGRETGKAKNPAGDGTQTPGSAGKLAGGPAPSKEPDPEPEGRFIVERGDLEIYSMAAPEKSLRIRAVSAEVPFSGVASEGWLEAAETTFDGGRLAGPLKVPLRWSSGVLEWPAGEFEWNGLTVQTAGTLRIRGRLAGTIEVRAVAPTLSPRSIPGWESAMFTTGPVDIRARLSGDVLRPVTWQGNLVAGVGGVQFIHRERGESLVFDRARLVTDLRGGVLQLVDGTLAGERLSLFGNGFMVLDGRVYGVARLVAAPDVAEAVTKVVNGTGLAPGNVDSWMSPLVTPDRYYRDVHAQGVWQHGEMDLGPRGEWVDAGLALRLIRMFVTREEAEEIMQDGSRKGGAGS